ncbi:hypothetical protein LY78DRAFT_708902, partial [Colletotrichum sublineola]
ETAIHRDAIELRDDIHRATNYPTFIRRLQKTDAQNLAACYLPQQSAIQNILRNPSLNDGCGFCSFCPFWLTGVEPNRDCSFLTRPLSESYTLLMEERREFSRWVRKQVVGATASPQPPSPMDDYIARVAEWSRRHSRVDNVWAYSRILDVMHEALLRVQGRQLTWREFLQTGWENTVKRIDFDWGTTAARVQDVLMPEWADELKKAIHFDARMYYVETFSVTEDQRCVYQQPRGWVHDELRRHPPGPCPWGADWQKILTVDRVWPLVEVGQSSNVFAKVQFRETSRGFWLPWWLGRLDTPGLEGLELSEFVRSNRWNKEAKRKADEWEELDRVRERELERERMLEWERQLAREREHEEGRGRGERRGRGRGRGRGE